MGETGEGLTGSTVSRCVAMLHSFSRADLHQAWCKH